MKQLVTFIMIACNLCGDVEDMEGSQYFHNDAQLLAARSDWLASWQWSADGQTPEICGRCVEVMQCEARGHQWTEWRGCPCERDSSITGPNHRCWWARFCRGCSRTEGTRIPSLTGGA